nr:unnamed protein product [Callosobruchus chinensis]
MKDEVYANSPASIQELKDGICEAIHGTQQPLCDFVMDNFMKRIWSYNNNWTGLLDYLSEKIDFLDGNFPSSEVALLGNFNVRNEAWLSCNKTDAAGRAVEAYAISQGLTQLAKETTFLPRVASHSTSLLDLFLTTRLVSYTIDVHSPLGNSDHGLDEADFLSGRKITVLVDGFFSSFHNINAGVPQGSVLAPTLFLLHINDLLSSITNPIHSFADDSTLHAGIMSSRPISVVEPERRRLATAASLSKDLEAITAWELKNMVEFNASKTQYCTLSNKRCSSEHSALINNQALLRSHSFKLLGVTITEKMICKDTARKYFSPSNLLTLYKAQIRPSVEYWSHIW